MGILRQCAACPAIFAVLFCPGCGTPAPPLPTIKMCNTKKRIDVLPLPPTGSRAKATPESSSRYMATKAHRILCGPPFHMANGTLTVCGLLCTLKATTDDPNKVTCKACLGRKKFKAVAAAAR